MSGEDVMIDIICIVDKEWVFNILARLVMEKDKAYILNLNNQKWVMNNHLIIGANGRKCRGTCWAVLCWFDPPYGHR
jgi:hypothetical protein